MNLDRRSVRPVLRSLCICVRSTGCCKIIFPERNLHGLASAWDFSQTYWLSVSKTRAPHLGHLPTGSWPVKSSLGWGSFDLAARVPALAARGSNSNVTLPSFSSFRYALKG